MPKWTELQDETNTYSNVFNQAWTDSDMSQKTNLCTKSPKWQVVRDFPDLYIKVFQTLSQKTAAKNPTVQTHKSVL